MSIGMCCIFRISRQFDSLIIFLLNKNKCDRFVNFNRWRAHEQIQVSGYILN